MMKTLFRKLAVCVLFVVALAPVASAIDTTTHIIRGLGDNPETQKHVLKMVESSLQKVPSSDWDVYIAMVDAKLNNEDVDDVIHKYNRGSAYTKAVKTTTNRIRNILTLGEIRELAARKLLQFSTVRYQLSNDIKLLYLTTTIRDKEVIEGLEQLYEMYIAAERNEDMERMLVMCIHEIEVTSKKHTNYYGVSRLNKYVTETLKEDEMLKGYWEQNMASQKETQKKK
jgi:hypothetical protein